MTFVSDFPDNNLTSAQPPVHRSRGSRSRVTLDRSWAEHLGVARSRGAYRIDRRALAGRLEAGLAGQEWEIDRAHSDVRFIARHLMLSKVRGGFREFSGSFRVGEVPEESSVEIEIQAASIDTGLAIRDHHLRSEDFLDVENYPQLKFRSTGLEQVRERSYRMTGDLTIRGVTNPVALDLDYLGAIRDTAGSLKAAFEARAEIDREEFGLTWNRLLESGGVMVDRIVRLEIEAQAVPKRAPAA